LNNAADNSQAESDAAGFSAAIGFEAKKWGQDPLAQVFGDARTVVMKRNVDVGRVFAEFEQDVIVGVAHGVAEKVFDRAKKKARVSKNLEGVGERNVDFEISFIGVFEAGEFRKVSETLVRVEVNPVDFACVRLNVAQEFGDELIEGVEFSGDGVDACAAWSVDVGFEELEVKAESRERRAELMRDRLDQFIAAANQGFDTFGHGIEGCGQLFGWALCVVDTRAEFTGGEGLAGAFDLEQFPFEAKGKQRGDEWNAEHRDDGGDGDDAGWHKRMGWASGKGTMAVVEGQK